MRTLHKPKRKLLQEYTYGTMDIETWPGKENSPLLGEPCYVSWCFGDRGFGNVCFSLTDWMLSFFLLSSNDNMILYVHNGFRFDYQRIDWQRLASLGYTVSFLTGRDGQVKSATITDGECKWFLRDSVYLIPLKLEKVTKTFSPDTPKYKRKLGFDIYPFNPFDMEDITYAVVDSVALYNSIATVDKLLQKHFSVSIHAGATLPSIAFRAFKQNMGEAEQYEGISHALLHAAQESYCGGQTIAFQTKLFEDVISIDCNSMYPYVMMRYPLPTGKVIHNYGSPEENTFMDSLCFCIGNIPSYSFPLLKTKSIYGTGNYCGVVAGWFWGFEIKKQRELGGKIEVLEYYSWSLKTDVAARFSHKCHDLRMSDYYGAIGALAKLLNNSLYGKFAQLIAEYLVEMSRNMPEDGIPIYNPSTHTSVKSLYYVKSKPNFTANMTHWASYITARARVELTTAIQKVGFDKIIYCDTDSLFFERMYINRVKSILGKEYGQFKIEKGTAERGILFQAFAPKAYKGMGEAKQDGLIVKNKGIPSGELKRQQGFIRLGRHGHRIKFIQTKSLFVKLKTESDYGRRSFRQVATSNSMTNGNIQDYHWHPVECENRSMQEIRGDFAKTPRFLQLRYDKIMREFRRENDNARRQETILSQHAGITKRSQQI